MRIVYCIPSIYNSGGMERVLSIKANYFADVEGYEMYIITTDQKNREPFFEFSKNIKFIDLKINYCDREIRNNYLNVFHRIIQKRIHKRRLSHILKKIKADIVISSFQNEASFLYSLNDGSKKIIESHFSRYIRSLNLPQFFLSRILVKYRLYKDAQTIRQYDRFVTLTNDDKADWPHQENIQVIPNPITINRSNVAELNEKRIIAVGRVTYQKGFDNLLKSWKIVSEKFPDWNLSIFGSLNDKQYFDYLKRIIQDNNIKNVVFEGTKEHIEKEYFHSSILVMSSVFEGLPLTLIEGMYMGLPCVSFSCKCGPSEIIEDGINGILVPPGDYEQLAKAIINIISDPKLMQKMSNAAIKSSTRFSLNNVMAEWRLLFSKLLEK